MLRGFDVSHYQGAVNWASLKSRYGITWGAAKATEAEGGRDAQFPNNWPKMKAAGLVRMAYHFAHPDGSPVDDARAFLAYVNASGGIDPEDIMVMDLESNPAHLSMSALRTWLAGWADEIVDATGRQPFLYCGSGYIQNSATVGLKSKYAAWWFPKYPSAYDGHTIWPSAITGYPSSNNWGGTPDIWQFSQSFAGSMDADIANMTLAELKTRGRDTIAPPPPDPPPPLSEDDDMFITRYGSSLYRMFIDRRMISLSESTYNALQAGGVPVRTLSNAAVDALESICDNYLLVSTAPTSDTEDAYLVEMMSRIVALGDAVGALKADVAALQATDAEK